MIGIPTKPNMHDFGMWEGASVPGNKNTWAGGESANSTLYVTGKNQEPFCCADVFVFAFYLTQI